MESRRTFGRRATPQLPTPRAVTEAAEAPSHPAFRHPVAPILSSPSPDAAFGSVDDEIAAWKASRGPVIPFPWRQLSLMAGICFGVASFVLPDTVNQAVQWPLYALTAISLYAGLRKRKSKAA
ncbi:MAG TPA: hypothetical protein VHX92_00275 [Rhizomicrobium sp.]|jgi:hypothetical protein|nr:hypothetical protein [Rhizomicrobium sp.]